MISLIKLVIYHINLTENSISRVEITFLGFKKVNKKINNMLMKY